MARTLAIGDAVGDLIELQSEWGTDAQLGRRLRVPEVVV